MMKNEHEPGNRKNEQLITESVDETGATDKSAEKQQQEQKSDDLFTMDITSEQREKRSADELENDTEMHESTVDQESEKYKSFTKMKSEEHEAFVDHESHELVSQASYDEPDARYNEPKRKGRIIQVAQKETNVQRALNPALGQSESNTGMKKLINRVLDLLLKKIKEEIDQPITIPDITEEFNKMIICLPMRMKIMMKNGKLFGIDTISYSKPATFYYTDPIADVEVDFITGNLTFSIEFQITINERNYIGIIRGNVEQVLSTIGSEINFEEETAELTRAELKRVEKLHIEIKSSGLIPKFINSVLWMVTTFEKNLVYRIAEKILHNVLQKKFPL